MVLQSRHLITGDNRMPIIATVTAHAINPCESLAMLRRNVYILATLRALHLCCLTEGA